MKGFLAFLTLVHLPACFAQGGLRDESLAALKKAATFYHTQVASHGGYAYYYSVDLKERWGEGVGTADQIWVQPPGTPAVGLAYLKAFATTGDVQFRAAAKDAATALIHGQLKSGGWTQTIDFDPQGSRVALYRNGQGKGRNHTSLDDNQTQTAIQFLVRMDQVLEFKDAAIHEAATVALDALLKAQFLNGAFPQGFTGPVAAHPVIKASFPEAWPRTWPNQNYWDYYTLNDGLAGSVAAALQTALEGYHDDRYRQALTRLGDFLILAQMPEPQPAWAQQYSYTMQPMWARKFEPPAICGLESEDAIRTLLKIHRLTGDRKYLEPIPRALVYLKKCRLPDGRMARYYELQTNRPLYMNRKGADYFLTYDDTALPSHYGWKQDTRVDELERELNDLQQGKARPAPAVPAAELEARVREIIRDLDDQGRWITAYAGEGLVGQPKFANGFRYLGSNVFIRNVEILCDYLAAGRSVSAGSVTPEGAPLRDALRREAELPGKPAWRPMLRFLAELHGRSVFPPLAHLPYPYESIGPGYQGGRVFGHIDLTHERLDTVRAQPEFVRNQIRNELAGQQADGLVPGIVIFGVDGKPWWKNFKGFPPIWVVSADAYVDVTGDANFLTECLEALRRQIAWFEAKRSVPGGGFYYLDLIENTWESGMDEGIRYDQRPPAPAACVDATSHLHLLYDHAARWSRKLGKPAASWDEKAVALRRFIQTELWDSETGFFYDRWVVGQRDRRRLAFEGMWPVVVGAATEAQARRVIDDHLMNSKEFFATHPIATVALSDPKFELRMWRGPAWNCMTYWAARGCVRYGRTDEARRMLEAALNATAVQFERTGTLWEFYHPQGGSPETLLRKPTGKNMPNRDYVGHNPLFAMIDLWRTSGGQIER